MIAHYEKMHKSIVTENDSYPAVPTMVSESDDEFPALVVPEVVIEAQVDAYLFREDFHEFIFIHWWKLVDSSEELFSACS